MGRRQPAASLSYESALIPYADCNLIVVKFPGLRIFSLFSLSHKYLKENYSIYRRSVTASVYILIEVMTLYSVNIIMTLYPGNI